MKTAEELYKIMVLGKESNLPVYKNTNYLIRFNDFANILAEHDKEIINSIYKTINELKSRPLETSLNGNKAQTK